MTMRRRKRRIMAAICKMKLTPEVCLRCGKPAWALFPLCLTWKSQNIVKMCFLQLSSLLKMEKTKDNDFSGLCKWSSGGASLLQMMIQRDQPLANSHPEGPASCKL